MSIVENFVPEFQTSIGDPPRQYYAMNAAEGWQLENRGNHYFLWARSTPYENMSYRIRKDAPWGAVLGLMGTARLRDFYIPNYGNQPQWDLYALSCAPEGALPHAEAEKWLWKLTPRPNLRHSRDRVYAHKEF